MKQAFSIEGMHCDGCVRRVKAVLGKIEGVSAAEVVVGRADVDLAGTVSPETVLEALKKAGYPSHATP